MKKVLVLLLALSSGVLYGVCACQLNKPKPQQAQPVAQQPVTKVEEKTAAPAQSNKTQDVKVADKK